MSIKTLKMKKTKTIIKWLLIQLSYSFSIGGLTVLLILAAWIGVINWSWWIASSLAATSYLAYPIAELLRPQKKINPLWIYLDDSAYNKDGSFAKDYYLWLLNNGGLKETFWQKYIWHAIRNKIWNFVSLFKPKEGPEIIYDMRINDLIFENKSLLITNDSNHPYVAALKFIDKYGNKGWNVNQGEYISYEHTIHGTSFFYYRRGGVLYFRFSMVKIFKIPFIGDRWITIKAGTNKHRHTISIKVNKLLEWK